MFGVTENLRGAMLFSTVLASAIWASQATAQFYKCVDAAGKATFSDQGCAASEEAAAIKVQPTNTIDNLRYQQRPEPEYAQSYAAQERPSTRSYVTVVGGTSDAERRRERACKEASTKHRSAHGLTAAQRVAAADLCLGVSLPMPDYATDPYAAPAPVPAPVPTTAPPPPASLRCDQAGCWDNNSQRYNHSAGSTYFPANGGSACQLVHGSMRCP